MKEFIRKSIPLGTPMLCVVIYMLFFMEIPASKKVKSQPIAGDLIVMTR